MSELAEQAARYCTFIEPGFVCKLMMLSAKETDPRCKYWRDGGGERCRYFELSELKRR